MLAQIGAECCQRLGHVVTRLQSFQPLHVVGAEQDFRRVFPVRKVHAMRLPRLLRALPQSACRQRNFHPGGIGIATDPGRGWRHAQQILHRIAPTRRWPAGQPDHTGVLGRAGALALEAGAVFDQPITLRHFACCEAIGKQSHGQSAEPGGRHRNAAGCRLQRELAAQPQHGRKVGDAQGFERHMFFQPLLLGGCDGLGGAARVLREIPPHAKALLLLPAVQRLQQLQSRVAHAGRKAFVEAIAHGRFKPWRGFRKGLQLGLGGAAIRLPVGCRAQAGGLLKRGNV
ncbi:hypothetical protein SDC9_66524 [bioreactor metagenome]|uniref:Uncharacterized protein n=1 Tax=bioreactor metagenome TaxID=1076179 RepID=A0A644XV96_9ZZZZ